MDSSADVKERKQNALNNLKFKRNTKGQHSTGPSPSSSSTASNTSQQTAPPPQSRDGTMSSRYFTPVPGSTPLGNVLVPSSSPISSPASQKAYQPYSHGRGHDTSFPLRNPSQTTSWGYTQYGSLGNDPLSKPTGFIAAQPNNAINRRPRSPHPVPDDEGPPRKRLNVGPPEEPDSPAIQRPGKRRRVVRGDSLSSSEDLPSVAELTGRPTRIKRRSPSPQASPMTGVLPSTPSKVDLETKEFNIFKLGNMDQPLARVRAAWEAANGDKGKANELLFDRSWHPPSTVRPLPSNFGRDKDVLEATKAQRAAVKEKGKGSFIYTLQNTNYGATPSSSKRPATPPPTQTVIDISCSSPVVAPPRKRLRQKPIDSDEEQSEDDDETTERIDQARVLSYFNTKNAEAIQELAGCSLDQANVIIGMRPFEDIDDLNTKLGQGKKKAGPAGISPRMFVDCIEIFQGYSTVDAVLEDCEKIGANLRANIESWTSHSPPVNGKGKAPADSATHGMEDGALSLRSIADMKEHKSDGFMIAQPVSLAAGVQLKEYQLLGVNWLNLLYQKGLSCILADEMGLGKTIQVISFFAHLKDQGYKGSHLIVVPSSTLENWCREFARFAPNINVQTYYGSKDERLELRVRLLETRRSNSETGDGWDVLVTTYNLAQGDSDRKFFRRIDWDCCVFDEGHVLKNYQSQRYQALLKVESKWRLLLTGTPLQNNLQELVSLMYFILPEQFSEASESLRAIFKVKGDSKVSLLAQERVSRAKKMMTPFVLRRRKDQVLGDLPKKTERIEWCEMSPLQGSIYKDTMQRSRKTICEVALDTPDSTDAPTPPNGRKKKAKPAKAKPPNTQYAENSANVLMDLRKAASHPMLFRKLFTDDLLTGMTKQLLKEPDFKKRGALFEHVHEDMSVMTDAELQVFCGTYKSLRKFLQDEKCYTDSGKIQVLLKLLAGYREEGRKVLIFSQFTQILDILRAILNINKVKYLLLTGSTPVDVRQALVDEFTEEEDIGVFLLSTKAGGMGINLTAASVVIMFDHDFNPHNDRQAQDRAYRIGQKRDVDVVKLISRNTIEEDMLRLGDTKLALDEAVAGENEEEKEGEAIQEKVMKTSLMNVLRKQFEETQQLEGTASEV